MPLDLNGLNNKLTIVFKPKIYPYNMDMLLKKELYEKIHFKLVIDL